MEILALVELDSGDYINTDFVQRIFMVEDWRVEFVGDITGDDRMPITDYDRDRIVEAMGGEPVTLPLCHHQYGLKPFGADDFKISDKS